MFLAILRLWNFRKYGEDSVNQKSGLEVNFNKGLNVLVGENDSGKTAIIDAIRYVLGTQSNDNMQLDVKDFFKSAEGKRADTLKIECIFKGFDEDGEEAASFIEWLNFDDTGEYELHIRLTARMTRDNRIPYDIKAGLDGADVSMDGNARDLLKVTYLKPLRDAGRELTPGYRSRLAQILKNHEVFHKDIKNRGTVKKHPLEEYAEEFDTKINEFFEKEEPKGQTEFISEQNDFITGKQIKDKIDGYLQNFFPVESGHKSKISITNIELIDILRKLNISIDENTSGLGSLNLLFMAVELLLLQGEEKRGLRLALIEEIEAHLHPQAQLRLIQYLKNKTTNGQFILTTHSTTLASSIKLENLIVCRESNVFPMGYGYTQLKQYDYGFLERFLDATKANLFFARGVILVEGDAENILIPTIAEIIGRPLHSYGVSVVNVGSTAFARYARIFMRKDGQQPWMDIPVAIITDIDVRPIEYYEHEDTNKVVYCVNDDNIEELKLLNNNIAFDNMKYVVCESKSKFEGLLKSNKCSRNPGISENVYDICKCEIDPAFISLIREERRKVKEANFAQQNVRIFVSQSWTLEYEVALSPLKGYMHKAILQAKCLKQNEVSKTMLKSSI